MNKNKHSIVVYYRGARFNGHYRDGDKAIHISGGDLHLFKDWYKQGVQFKKKNIIRTSLVCMVDGVEATLLGCYPFDSVFGWMLLFKDIYYSDN